MSPENAALRSTLRARRLHGGFFGRSAKRHVPQYNITHTHTQGNFNMFRIPRRISDTLHAAPYTGGFVVSLLEALLTSSRRQVGEWGITSLKTAPSRLKQDARACGGQALWEYVFEKPAKSALHAYFRQVRAAALLQSNDEVVPEPLRGEARGIEVALLDSPRIEESEALYAEASDP